MTIKRKPQASAAKVAAFIGRAPDGGKAAGSGVYEKGIAKGNRRQISLTIAPDTLRMADEIARESGMTRAGVINLAVTELGRRYNKL